MWLLALFVAGAVIALAIRFAESAVKVRAEKRQPVLESEAAAALGSFGKTVDPVEIFARDGIALRGWLFHPVSPNGEAVILLHGFTNSRRGMFDHARLYLKNGFTVLTPDSRGHGNSGGKLVSFGIREVRDLRDWVGWLVKRMGVEKVFGHGHSMGAGVLLQSLDRETRWKAVVAESSFTRFREIAYERMAGRVRINSWVGRALLLPVGESGLLYIRLRYGANLRKARPIEQLRKTRTRVMLIHGRDDQSIPFQQSGELHRSNPEATELWIVPGARHTTCLATAGDEYERRLMTFLGRAT